MKFFLAHIFPVRFRLPLLLLVSGAFLGIPARLAAQQASLADSGVLETSSSSLSLPDAPLPQQQTQPAAQTPPQTPAQKPSAPSLSDLGLSPTQTAANPALQARLDRHTQMLKIHQRLGLLTLIPLAATLISSGGATAGHHNGTQTAGGNTVGRDLHASLGSVAVGMYAATAWYAIRAPKISEGPVRGGIKFHKYLIYIHAPGMVLTPILGAMAFDQLNKGEKVHGIASAHAAVAWTTVAAYTAAIVSVSWPIHLKL
ncbi:MAG TPA: hypothetical protein VIJ65_01460 [Acidobacteriaceae bacterium]